MSNNVVTVRNELTKYAQQIENLAKQVQTQLALGNTPLSIANELVRNSSTFVFVLGELSALESKSNKKVKTTTVNNPNGTKIYYSYHNIRDSLGRFTSAAYYKV